MSETSTEYEIGGVHVTMTPSQAARWNAGQTTGYDLRRVIVADTSDGNQCRYLTLRRATNSRLEPVLSDMLEGMPANRAS